MRWLQRGYDRLLGRIIRTPRRGALASAVFAAGVIGLFALAALPFLATPLLPSFKEPNITIHWEAPPGTSYPEMSRITTRASRELQAIPGVRNVAANVGRAVLGDQIVDVNSAQIAVSVDAAANYDATLAAVRRVVSGYPGLRSEVQTYLKETTGQVLTGSSDDLVVRLSGPELATLRAKAEEVRQVLTQVAGATAVHLELQVEQPQVDIEVDLAKAQRYGLKPGDVRRAASTLVAGIEAGSLFEEQKVFQVMVWGTPETRHSLSSIRDLLIDTPSGDHVRLGDVADVRILPTPNLVEREHNSRRIDVGLTVRGRDLGAAAAEVQQRLRAISFPLEYRAEVLGEYQERQAAQARLLTFGVIAALLVLLILQTAFGSWRLALLTFFTLPSALVGGVLAAYATGGILSLGSLVGFFTVFGIAARNGVMLINHYQHLERQEGMTFGLELAVRGARERLAPILMTALAAGLALVPLAISGDIPGHEIEHPMAIVILGGLVTSTVLNLFIVPSLYLRFGRSSARQAPAPATA